MKLTYVSIVSNQIILVMSSAKNCLNWKKKRRTTKPIPEINNIDEFPPRPSSSMRVPKKPSKINLLTPSKSFETLVPIESQNQFVGDYSYCLTDLTCLELKLVSNSSQSRDLSQCLQDGFRYHLAFYNVLFPLLRWVQACSLLIVCSLRFTLRLHTVALNDRHTLIHLPIIIPTLCSINIDSFRKRA